MIPGVELHDGAIVDIKHSPGGTGLTMVLRDAGNYRRVESGEPAVEYQLQFENVLEFCMRNSPGDLRSFKLLDDFETRLPGGAWWEWRWAEELTPTTRGLWPAAAKMKRIKIHLHPSWEFVITFGVLTGTVVAAPKETARIQRLIARSSTRRTSAST
jgi:hypothetical protein